MILNLTPEQIKAIEADAPEDAKYFAIDKNGNIYYFSTKPQLNNPGHCWRTSDGGIYSIKAENWRELCFEINRDSEELPVNEDCLFQPVLFENKKYLYLGNLSYADKIAVIKFDADCTDVETDIENLKRIPDFKYKKPEWL